MKISDSIDELDQAIKDKSFEIVNYFIQDNELSEYSYLNLGEDYITPIIRYSNHPDSIELLKYDSSGKIDG